MDNYLQIAKIETNVDLIFQKPQNISIEVLSTKGFTTTTA